MNFSSKKVLVTGGAGFIGSHLVDRLIEENYEVVVIDDLSTGRRENLNEKAVFYNADICSSEVAQIFEREKPKIVFHYAAQISVRKSAENPLEDAQTNILGALNLLENCRRYGVRKFIFASTGGAIYGDADVIPTPEVYPEVPVSPYGIAKLTIEKYLDFYHKAFGLPSVSLRMANVYGPRQDSRGEAGVIAIFCGKMLLGKQPIINGDGNQTRDFVFVNDVIEANILAIKKNKTGIFNIGTAKETDINTIFGKLKKLAKSKCEERHGPPEMGEQKRSCLDFSKVKRELGWQPKHSLEEGLEKTLEWFKQRTINFTQ